MSQGVNMPDSQRPLLTTTPPQVWGFAIHDSALPPPPPNLLLLIPTIPKGQLHPHSPSLAGGLFLLPSPKKPVPPQRCFKGPYKLISSKSLHGYTSSPLTVDGAYEATVAFANISLITLPISPTFIHLHRWL